MGCPVSLVQPLPASWGAHSVTPALIKGVAKTYMYKVIYKVILMLKVVSIFFSQGPFMTDLRLHLPLYVMFTHEVLAVC